MSTLLTASPNPIPDYFVVMIDYGRSGREAVVDPEVTRREVVSRIASGEYAPVLFVHEHHRDGTWSDVTAEIIAEARPVFEEAA